MPWNDLANNQTISFTNLRDGVNTGSLSQKTTIPISNEQITKAEANTYVNIDTSFSSYAAKASNQLVVKSDLKSNPNVVFTNAIIWFGIANNETTSSPIQLLCGWNDGNDDGRIYRSTDYGSSYSSVLTINQRLYDIKYLGNEYFGYTYRHASYLTVPPFLAVGEGGRIVTNSVTNSSSWVTISSPTTQDLFAVAFRWRSSDPQAVIVGNSRILRTTTLGRINAWTVVNSNSNVWRDVASSGIRFIAVGDNSSIITSGTDLNVWTPMSMPPLVPSKQLRGITYNDKDGYWYAVGYDTANPNLAYMMRSYLTTGVWETYTPAGDAFLSGLTSITTFWYSPSDINAPHLMYVGGVNYQYIINNGVATRYDASFSGYSSWWMSAVKHPDTNGFDMAASLVVFGNEFNGQNGGHSNF